MPPILRVLVALAVLFAAAASCAEDDDPGQTTTTTTTTSTTTTTTTTTTAPEPTELTAVSVYFLDADAERLRVGWVREVEVPEVASGALAELLGGPSSAELELGMTTAVPDGTQLEGVAVEDGTASVDLSGEFASGGGTLSMNARVAQVVYTATQWPEIDDVRILLDGEPVGALGGEGLVIDRPLNREDFEFQGDYEHVAPGILVETPRPGERVDAALRVAGSSNTFEAAMYFEVLDADNEAVLEETFVMASAGTGTRGTFDATLDVGASGEVTLLAYERSARDGSRVDVVEIPLVIRD